MLCMLYQINDKNKRIAKIFSDLNIGEVVKVLSLTTREKPEMLLTVADSEVSNQLTLSPLNIK